MLANFKNIKPTPLSQMQLKHNEQINNQNINNSECFGEKNVKIYREMTSQ